MDRLAELATFLAVVDHGGFLPAARSLRTSAPTVTRLVGRLERRLGQKLLDRTSRRCVLTAQGTAFAARARSIVADYESAISQAEAEAGAPEGMIRLTAPHVFGREHIAPAVLRFLDVHRGISVELDLDDRVVDLHGRAFDLALRIGPVGDETLQATRVGSVRRVIVASPDYLESRGLPRGAADLQRHTRIQHGTHARAPWRLRGTGARSLLVASDARFTVNQADAALAAARSGHGLVTALSYQVHADLVAGTLVRVLSDLEPEPLPVWLCWPEERHKIVRIRLLIDFLTSELRQLAVLRAPSP